MLFKREACNRSTVRTQNKEKYADSLDDVYASLGILFNDPEEFIVLTLEDSKVKHGIQYIQSAWTADGLTVQAGVEEKGMIRLVEKYISPFECEKIYKKFFETSEVENIKDYSEVKFK